MEMRVDHAIGRLKSSSRIPSRRTSPRARDSGGGRGLQRGGDGRDERVPDDRPQRRARRRNGGRPRTAPRGASGPTGEAAGKPFEDRGTAGLRPPAGLTSRAAPERLVQIYGKYGSTVKFARDWIRQKELHRSHIAREMMPRCMTLDKMLEASQTSSRRRAARSFARWSTR